VRESREPAPLMGRVSFVQTAWAVRLFPFFLLTTPYLIRHIKGVFGE
jgi:hypothetical protein